jgi:hypothetical protein
VGGLVVFAVACAALSVLCARAAVANYREYRRERDRAPLEPAEVYETSRRSSSIRPPWPQPEDITDHRLAAAYRDYARDRQESAQLIGEITLLTSGAALGTFIPRVLTSSLATAGATAAVVVGGGGFLMKQYGAGRWARIAARYERRRAELRPPAPTPPAPPAPARRRRWWPW